MTEREWIDLLIGQTEARISDLTRLMQIYRGLVVEMRDALRLGKSWQEAVANVERNTKLSDDETRVLRTFVDALGNRPGLITEAEHNRLTFLKRQVETGEVTEW